MKVSFSKITLVAGILLAMALIFSCSGDGSEPPINGGVSSGEETPSSSSVETGNKDNPSSSSMEANKTLSSSSGAEVGDNSSSSSSSFGESGGTSSSSNVEMDKSSSSGSNENGSSSSSSLSSSSGPLKECTGIFNPDNKFCYDGVVYDKCDGMEYNPTTYYCQGGVAYPAVCNGAAYNPLKQDCCVSTIYNLSNQKCEGSIVKNQCVLSPDPSMMWYNPVTQICCSGKIYNSANPTTQFCNGDNIFDKCDGNEYNPATQYCRNGTTVTTYGSISYGDKTYKTLDIGEQTWMAENLNYATSSGSVCYDNSESYCNTYGRLYNWATAMEVCPNGWHIPSLSDWNMLITAVGGLSIAGKYLKAIEDRYFISISGYGVNYYMNTYGFTALLGGGCYPTCYDVSSYGNWWSETEGVGETAYGIRVYYDYEYINSSTYDKPTLFSVRCVRN